MIMCFCGGSGLRHFWKDLFERVAQSQLQSTQATQLGCGQLPRTQRWSIVVAMTDDGGSSRAIMDALGGLPVGDCRNVALAVVDGMLTAVSQVTRRQQQQVHSSHSHNNSGYVVSEQSLEVVSWMCGLLSRRLCPDDGDRAQQECRDLLAQLLQYAATSSCHQQAAQHAHKALSTFWDAIVDLRTAAPNFTFRNASVGNLVLCGLLLQELDKGTDENQQQHDHLPAKRPTPLHDALNVFLCDLLLFKELCAALNVEVDIVPTLEYERVGCVDRSKDDAAGAWEQRPLCRLPRVALEVEWADGTTTWGQRAVSYGDAAGDEDALVTHKHIPVGGCDNDDVCPIATRGMPTRINIWQEGRPEDSNSGAPYVVIPSPVVKGVLQHNAGEEHRCIFARGSLLTSTLAAVAPHLSVVGNAFDSHHRSVSTSDVSSQEDGCGENRCRDGATWTLVTSGLTSPSLNPSATSPPTTAPMPPQLTTGLMVNGWVDNETLPFVVAPAMQDGPNCCGEDGRQRLDVGQLISFIHSQFPSINVSTIWLPTAATAPASPLDVVVMKAPHRCDSSRLKFDVSGVSGSIQCIAAGVSGGSGIGSGMFDDCVLAQHVHQFTASTVMCRP